MTTLLSFARETMVVVGNRRGEERGGPVVAVVVLGEEGWKEFGKKN